MSRQQALKGELNRFSRTTTIRGIMRIANPENSITLRTLWCIAVVSASSITIYQLALVVSRYLQYQENVNMFYLGANPEFPDVTACKVNPYSHRWIDPSQPQADEYYKFVQQLQSGAMAQYEHLNSLANSSEQMNKIMDFLLSPDGHYANLMLNEYELWPNMSTMIRDIGFYSWNLMKYRQDPDLSLFSVLNMVYNPDFQICYQLHLPETRARDVRALSAIFYTRDFPTDSIRTFDTSLRVSPTPSVAIVLHERGSYPVTTLAVNVAPGHETTVSIRATIVKRLGNPFDSCEPIQYLTKTGGYEPGAIRYSVDACYDLCIQHHIMNKCQCIDSTRTFTPVEINSGIPLCGHMNFTHGTPPTADNVYIALQQLNCYFESMSRIETHIYTPDCRCPPPCLEYSYQTSVYHTQWPHRSFQLAFYDEFIKGNPTFGRNFDVYSDIENDENLTALQKLEKLNSLHLIEQNFLRLKIVFEDRGMQTYNSTPALTWEGLASNIGGSLSLWIGITVMTLFEFVELVIRLVQLYMARYENSNKSSAKNTEANESENNNGTGVFLDNLNYATSATAVNLNEKPTLNDSNVVTTPL